MTVFKKVTGRCKRSRSLYRSTGIIPAAARL